MLYIWFTIAAIIIFGGIIAYALSTAMNQVDAAMIATYPAMASDAGMIFVGSIWYWMVLVILIAAVIYVVVNSQKQQPGVF